MLVCVLALVAAQATQPESAVLYNASTDTYQLCVECGHLANAAAWGTSGLVEWCEIPRPALAAVVVSPKLRSSPGLTFVAAARFDQGRTWTK